MLGQGHGRLLSRWSHAWLPNAWATTMPYGQADFSAAVTVRTTTLVLACLRCPDDSTAFEGTSTVSMLADEYRRDANASRALDGGGHRARRMWGLRCRLASPEAGYPVCWLAANRRPAKVRARRKRRVS